MCNHWQAWLIKPCHMLSAPLTFGAPNLLDAQREHNEEGSKAQGAFDGRSLNPRVHSCTFYSPHTHRHKAGLLGTMSERRNKQLVLLHWGLGCCMLQQAASLSQLVDHCVCCVCAKLLQLCPTLGDTMDRSSPGFSVCGILQARILKWIAAPFSREPSWPRKVELHLLCILHWQAGSLPRVPRTTNPLSALL